MSGFDLFYGPWSQEGIDALLHAILAPESIAATERWLHRYEIRLRARARKRRRGW